VKEFKSVSMQETLEVEIIGETGVWPPLPVFFVSVDSKGG